MKNKMFTVGVISLLTVLVLIVGYRMYTSSTKSTSEVFTQLIYEDKYSQLDDRVLKRYKKDIYEELSLIKKNSTLLTSYLSLGKINALQKNYEESNRYLINGLSFTASDQLELTFFIYEQLASNYIQLNQKEQGYKYFRLAYELASQLNDVTLITSLYQSFSASLFLKTDDMAFSIYLMNQTLDLLKDDDTYVQSHILLASMYQSSGLYKLALNQWIEALNLSREKQHHDLEAEILPRIATLYYLTDQHEEVLITLNQYFEFKYSSLSLDCISIWLQSYYQVYGFEATCEMFRQLDDGIAELSQVLKYAYQYLIYSNYASILLHEKRYDECQKYIEIIKYLHIPESVGSIPRLWFSGLELDFNYIQNNHKIDYKASYAQLLSSLTQEKSYYTQTEYLFIHSLLKTLLQLEDFESINNYYKLNQFPIKEDLGKMMNMTRDNSTNDILRKKWNGIETLTIFYYLAVIFSITGIVYVFGYHRPKIRMLNSSHPNETEIDSLTKTLKKEVLYHQLEFDIDSDSLRELSFILLDIDDFKSYNQEFGYLAGDKVLQEIAIILKQFFPNAYICRYLGQQFLIIIKDNQQPSQLELINEVMEVIKTSKEISGKREITVSVGISCGQIEDVLEVNDHMHIAAHKLRTSKRIGRGICTI